MISRSRRVAASAVADYRDAFAHFSRNARAYLWMAAIQNVAMGMLVTVFAIYVKTAGMSEAVVGDVEGTLAIASAVVGLLAAPLISVFGYRRLMLLAAAAYAVARIGQAAVPVASAMLLFGLASGVGDGVMRSASSAFLSENSLARERTHLFSADLVIRVLAGCVGSLAGGALPLVLLRFTTELTTYRATVLIAGVIFACSALPLLWVKEDLHPAAHAFAAYRETVRRFRSWGHLLRLGTPQFVISIGAGLIMPFLSLYLKHQLGAGIGAVGVIQGVAQVAMGLAALAAPLLGRRFGLIGGTVITEVLSLPFLAMLPLVTWLPGAAMVLWARTALMNMSWPLINQYSMEGVPSREKPLVAGGLAFAWSAGWLVGSVAGGRLMQVSYTMPYYITAAIYGLGALMTWLLLGRRDVRPDAKLAE